MKLLKKDGHLFAVDEAGNFIGKIINEISGGCCDNPENSDSGTFARIFEGHGYIYHQDDIPPNPFFIKYWGDIFQNPEMLPSGTKNVFLDQSEDAAIDFRAVPI